MAKIKLEMEIDSIKAFRILLDSLNVTLDEDINHSSFIIEDGKIVVKDYDDRGELYLALISLSNKDISKYVF